MWQFISCGQEVLYKGWGATGVCRSATDAKTDSPSDAAAYPTPHAKTYASAHTEADADTAAYSDPEARRKV